MQPTRHGYFILAALTGALLLTLSWQPFGLVFPVFAGFVPLLWLEHRIRLEKRSSGWVFLYAYLTFVCWNIGTTWWVKNASIEGAVMAFTLNSLLMCLPVMLYHRLQFRMRKPMAVNTFLIFWIAFEYGHYNWEATWPWITLGNVFSSMPSMVQWYEYTGVFGGSFWILWVNLQLFRYMLHWRERSVVMRYSKGLNLVFFLLFAPLFLSWWVGTEISIAGKNLNVVVVQPNIDPYSEKFGGMSPVAQTVKMLRLAEQTIDSNTQLVCFPETALVGSIREDDLGNHEVILLLRQFLLAHPHITILTGADTYRFYPQGGPHSNTARKYRDDLYYDAYNTALMLNNAGNEIQVYHKSKLVPGVERLPYAYAFGFIKQLTVDLGGTSGSLGCDSTSKVLFLKQWPEDFRGVAPVICYESVFGEYVASYVQKGAGLIGIITNDGWWGNTPGYKQHFDYARLRAIETRRYVARAANTGISGFIDPKGNVLNRSEWWTEDALKQTVVLNTGETFYVKYGDWMGVICGFLAIYYLLINRKKLPAQI